jgi:hypothetical protein
MNESLYGWPLPFLAAPVLVPDPSGVVFGYVGSAGIGALGVLLVVVAVLLIGAVGLVLHPIRVLLRRRRRLRQEQGYSSQDTVSVQPLEESN